MLENEGNLTSFSPLYNQEMSIGCSFTLKIKKMKKVLFCLLVIVCIAISWSCQNTKRYKIPKTNKVLLIYRPWFTGAAYVTVRDSGATTLKKSDVDVIRVPVYETTELNFVLDLSDPDKIYYVDPWNIATPYPRQKKYKRIMYEDRRFYQPRTRTLVSVLYSPWLSNLYKRSLLFFAQPALPANPVFSNHLVRQPIWSP